MAKRKGGEALTLSGMPETTVFWNQGDSITIQQTNDLGEESLVTVMPEAAERLCAKILAVRDQMANI